MLSIERDQLYAQSPYNVVRIDLSREPDPYAVRHDVAGEASGDNVGGLLSAELRLLRPDIELFGLGGDRMFASGVELLYHTNLLSFLGFWEVLKHLGFIRRVEQDLLSKIDEKKPSLAILIDYPGFNMRLAKKLRERKIPVMYYVSPQVWAWGKGRIPGIKNLVDKMVVVFQFEKEIYEKEGLPAEWYGHPLLEIVSAQYTREDFLRRNGFRQDERLIGLFPGSRLQEIERILPVMKDAFARLLFEHSNFLVRIRPFDDARVVPGR